MTAAKKQANSGSGEFRIRIGRSGERDPDARDLAEFMMLLRGVYVVAVRVHRKRSSQGADNLKKALASLSMEDMAELFEDSADNASLLTRSITHQSPVEIVLYGIGIPLTWAVILLGGKVKGPLGFSADIPSGLLTAIKKLRELLSGKSKTAIGYGPRQRQVKLSKEELELLKKPADRDRGGFQRFLVELQMRVNETTRELILYPKDIDRILRQGANPKKGGFQSRIRKVFGRHFDWPQ